MGSMGLTGKQVRMVAVLLLGALLVVLNQTLLSPSLPYIMTHLDVSETTVQWLTSGYALTEAIVIPLAAWFMGRFSTRILFTGGMGIFALGSLLAATAPSFPFLLLGRVVQAASTGIMMVLVMSVILLTFPREKRGQAMGVVSLVINFAPAIGPTVGGALVDSVGWRAQFLIVMAIATLILISSIFFIENKEGFERTKIDPSSVVLSCLGLASMLYGLSSFASSSNTIICLALIVFGAVLVAFFVSRQFKIDNPLLRLEILRSRRYRMAMLSLCTIQAVLIGLGVLLPIYLQNVLGYSALMSGLVTLPGAVLGAFTGLLSGRVFDRSGVRKVSVFGSSVMLLGLIGMFMYQIDSPMLYVIITYIVYSFGTQLITTPINTWGVNSLDNELVQHATATTNTMNQVGGSLGTALIVSFSALGTQFTTTGSEVYRTWAGYHVAFGVAAGIAAITFLLVLVSIRNKKNDQLPSSVSALGAQVQSKVSDVMHPNPVTVLDTDPLSVAVQTLADTNVSGLVLVSEAGEVKGFLSNSDILRFFGDQMQTLTGLVGFTALRKLDDESLQDRVGRLSGINSIEVATRQVIGISPDDTFEEACRLLADRRLKSLPVIDTDGKLVGIVRRGDLMRFLSGLLED